MTKLTVVGSGASGVHFALSALEQGHRVEMIDVGFAPQPPVKPDDSFLELKSNLEDPANYFLGLNNEGILLPGYDGEYYGLPPSKDYALRTLPKMSSVSRNFMPMFSFAQGGLAEMWTGGCYPFNDTELEAFPFGYDELAPHYARIAKRIGISGVRDDLSAFIPFHEGLHQSLRLDENSELLLSRYQSQRDHLRTKLGCYLGHARHAVLAKDSGSREGCKYLGRCLWGCPVGALYTPAATLRDCMTFPHFKYTPGYFVTHFRFNEAGHIESLVAEPTDSGEKRDIPVETVVLASGTLGSSRIVLESIFRKTGQVIKLPGLMDNRQILIPFINLRMIGRAYQPNSYQYNQLAMGLIDQQIDGYVHCLITTLKTAMIHPIVERIPFDLKTALHLFRNVHAALGLVNVNFHDTRRDNNYLTLNEKSESEHPELMINYVAPENEAAKISATLKRLKRILWRLGCIVPPGMAHVRPMGASVHYAGTIPMSDAKRPWTVSKSCRSHDFANLYFADGTTFPFLPAKNTTFTLMANATRVAAILGKGKGFG